MTKSIKTDFISNFKLSGVKNGDMANKQHVVLSALKALYSDSVHDLSVDVCGENFSGKDDASRLFRAKFQLLLPVELLEDLESIKNLNHVSEGEANELRKKLANIDIAVREMTQAEKIYEGGLKNLRFGVKFDKRGRATYLASYSGCKNENGIEAGSAKELLELLLSVKE